jgi:hypothetical protein
MNARNVRAERPNAIGSVHAVLFVRCNREPPGGTLEDLVMDKIYKAGMGVAVLGFLASIGLMIFLPAGVGGAVMTVSIAAGTVFAWLWGRLPASPEAQVAFQEMVRSLENPDWRHHDEIRRSGLRARGRIVTVEQTGHSSSSLRVEVLVEVNHPQRGIYQAKTSLSVDLVEVPRVQPNSNVEVCIDPQNPQDIVLVL